jgi:hypothetical protein
VYGAPLTVVIEGRPPSMCSPGETPDGLKLISMIVLPLSKLFYITSS